MTTDTAFAYCPTLARMIAEQRWVDDSGKVYDAFGLSTNNNLFVIRRMMLEFRPEKTLEIGLSMGASALVFTQSHQDLGHAPSAQHVAIDPWQSEFLHGIGLQALERASLSDYVEFVEQTSDLALPRMLEQGRSFDLIYIDGSHFFEDVFLDVHYAYHLLSAGGTVLLDDSSDPNIGRVVSFIRKNMGYGLEEVDVGQYRDDGGKALRYRVGKALGKVQLTAFRKVGEGRRPVERKTRKF